MDVVRPKLQQFCLHCLTILLCGTLTHCAVKEESRWPTVLTMIREQYPTVKQMTTQQLAQLLSTEGAEKPILIDVRESHECAVSHLQNALKATTKEEVIEILKNIEKDQLIVVYCSVGYRSSNIAKQLQAIGYMQVYNLEGAIFKWANEGLPLYKGEQQVTHVHPYNEEWGSLLEKSLWSIEPASLD